MPARHHWRWIEHLTAESQQRLLIISPPGHAKSTWISQIWPCWYIGNHAEHNIAIVSNTASQAELFMGVVKDTIEQNPLYQEVFPEVRPNYGRGWSATEIFVQRADLTNKDPTCFATGVGGPLIGKRLHLAIVDDPLDEENTATELQRERVKTWYKRTLLSRLRPEGRVVVILTRWHEDDLAQDLIDSGDYLVLHMKAIGEDGQALWPQMWPLERLEEQRRELGTPIFQCMYQGDPTALGGDIFRREWFKDCAAVPDGLRIYQAWDLAISQKETADYTCGCTIGMDREQNVYILDLARDRWTFHEQQERIRQFAAEWQPLAIGIESVAYQAAAVQEALRGSLWPFAELRPDRDKVSRARLLASRGEAGKVYVRKRASWWDALEAEIMAFPRGRHDDQVDALVYALLLARDSGERLPLPAHVWVGGKRK